MLKIRVIPVLFLMNGLIVRSDARPGRSRVPGRAHWVVHASETWSRAHLEDPAAEVQARLQDALVQQVGQPLAWRHASVHRWRYAHAPADAAVPGQAPRENVLRLSFVTVPPEAIERGVAALAGVLKEALQ